MCSSNDGYREEADVIGILRFVICFRISLGSSAAGCQSGSWVSSLRNLLKVIFKSVTKLLIASFTSNFDVGDGTDGMVAVAVVEG